MEINSELRSKETWLISEDGLWDIAIVLVILGWGLTALLRHPIWFFAAIMLAYFFVVMAGIAQAFASGKGTRGKFQPSCPAAILRAVVRFPL